MKKQPVAIVYLKKEGNEKYKLELYTDELVATRGDREERQPVELIKRLDIEDKKLILPAIAGGISGSFAFISIWMGLFDPVYPLAAFLLSVYLLFIGFRGSPHLVVDSGAMKILVPVYDHGKQIIEFVRFFNSFRSHGGGQHSKVYIPVGQPAEDGGYLAFTRDQLKVAGASETEAGYYEVDMLENDVEVKYESRDVMIGLQPVVVIREATVKGLPVKTLANIMRLK